MASPALEGMDYTVSAAKFSPSGTILALGSADLRLFDATDPVRTAKFTNLDPIHRQRE